jgi:AcrR family transcriptional regulator
MHVRMSQAERRAQTRAALLESAARGISTNGYSNLNLADVARTAGYTRGALYHLFADKEELALAVVAWVTETWEERVGSVVDAEADPLGALIALARAHVRYCRDGRARVMMTLRVEFTTVDHPVGRAAWDVAASLQRRMELLIRRARRNGSIPSGPPARVLAGALLAAIEGLAIGIAGRTPHDEALAERLVVGVLAVPA